MKSPGLKAIYNEALFDLVIRPEGPILVKSASTLDATKPDMQFVRLMMPPGFSTVYLPGASIKGVVRSTAERLLRTMNLYACDPLGDDRCKGSHKSKLHYSRHCYACRTFGSTDLASRIAFEDAYPWEFDSEPEKRADEAQKVEKYLQVRSGIGVDRKLGTVKHGAVFDLEVLTGGEFHTRISARNYQLWQLGLLLYVFDELNSGAQKFGFGKTRMGRIKVDITRLTIRQFGNLAKDDKTLAGIGKVPDLQETYKLVADDELKLTSPGCFDLLALQFDFAETTLAESLKLLLSSPSMKKLLSGEGSHAAH